MLRLIVLAACTTALVSGQNADPSLAKILKEQRFNVGDGRAGSAFATENGVIFKEETAIDGSRIGQYSYVGEDGKTYTVKYSAGKEGFRILNGDHIPSGGQDAAPFVAEPEEELYEEEPLPPVQEARPVQEVRPVQEARPVVRARPVAQPRPEPRPQQLRPVEAIPEPRQVLRSQIAEQESDPNYNPFINPHDPTHRNFQFNRNAVKFNPNHPLAQQLAAVPPCAGCEGVNPFINPFDETHSSAGLLAGHQAGLATRPAPRRVVPAQPARPALQSRPAFRAELEEPVARKNFFPPGELNLNRHETGFDFSFQS